MNKIDELTPKKVVEKLDNYIIGQKEAKKQVAIALRNRIRRLSLSEDVRKDVIPKNILMIGSTGVGKTEIARRLAEVANAPFVKVEATRFTEVGYVGKNVESMVRELVDSSVNMVKKEMMEEVKDKAQRLVEERIVEVLVPSKKRAKAQPSFMDVMQLFNQNAEYSQNKDYDENEDENIRRRREELLEKLRNGELEDVEIEVEVEEQSSPMFAGLGPELEDMGIQFGEMFQNLMPKKKKRRRMKISEARKVLEPIESEKLIDQDKLIQEGVSRAENSGIIFIDEIDKITSKGVSSGPDVSREGVQRDLLPIVEGTTVMTKYGSISTDYILFIAAGAFSEAKPSDLIPELQGRFPIRAELSDLTKEDFIRILTQPKNAILKQYQYLLQTDGVKIEFTEDGVERMADIAFELNEKVENIGARRLYTVVEKVLEEVSFEAPASGEWELKIDSNYVDLRLGKVYGDEDLREYIL
ncbi:heat shock protein HslVU, ATPase subunit HslU [Petrotoga mobilis SJ95]|uniref:ATP-dependent protease ATPase subunit HslU n=1 Tax=Petrotoga mobilis (strain DSM 10674 / SJ95) TaxID=403833 RepID=HSLU_PETMO|nr:ATP-dependent protease ATPase subunit HslU [Petrotoga mobilis]A9BID3.1 RecName: Full=ATP-dependent protease ATPase subunit HslU; AltName: Full=Unfoldase HslU [Petrotoga mobilis SJ95]ABX32605.1 heat shock protein HslVU, ATPase subunit HslU [Petrotoga mobilis SJ95]